MIDMFLGLFPFLGEMTIVQQDRLLNVVGDDLGVLLSLFALLIDLGNLCTMGPPLSLCIIHLKEWISKVIKTPYICSLPGVPASGYGERCGVAWP